MTQTKRKQPVPTPALFTVNIDHTHGVGPFLGSDFHFPVGAGKTNRPGSKPQFANPGDLLGLVANGRIVATVTFLGVEYRLERVEHIHSTERRDRRNNVVRVYENRGPGWVLAVDPATWTTTDIPTSGPGSRSYGYYTLVDGVAVQTVRSAA